MLMELNGLLVFDGLVLCFMCGAADKSDDDDDDGGVDVETPVPDDGDDVDALVVGVPAGVCSDISLAVRSRLTNRWTNTDDWPLLASPSIGAAVVVALFR